MKSCIARARLYQLIPALRATPDFGTTRARRHRASMVWLNSKSLISVNSIFPLLNFSPFKRWINPTGGLWWHAQAVRSQSTWKATTTQTQEWMLTHSPHGVRLVIVGASAGWMLSHQWLTRFQEIHTWDIDPLSKRLFGWLHGSALQRKGISWVHHCQDAWQGSQAWEMAGPDTLYWFDNILGQLPLIFLLSEVHDRIAKLHHVLARCHWGSVHDRYSGPISSRQPIPEAWLSQSGTLINDPRAQAWLHRWGGKGEWSDHLTSNVFRPDTPVMNVAWAFKPDMGHWLEMGWQPPIN